jgi:hypothetical protein
MWKGIPGTVRQAIRDRDAQRFAWCLWHIRWWIVLVVAAAALVFWTQRTSEKASDVANENRQLIGQVVKLTQTVAANQRATTHGLVESCRQNGNPLRRAVRKQIRKGFTDPKDPRLKELLPNVPQTVINRIAREGNREARAELAEITDVECAAQYR